ncbi:hypothetical protein GCM10009751_20360 [Myceligenerans crystallogenes]|uniref:Uncharacterized protein n=1 Tax=Myceligenerans crystallogenes TaxID=316335 RepID=A0ABN2NC27_9MICO
MADLAAADVSGTIRRRYLGGMQTAYGGCGTEKPVRPPGKCWSTRVAARLQTVSAGIAGIPGIPADSTGCTELRVLPRQVQRGSTRSQPRPERLSEVPVLARRGWEGRNPADSAAADRPRACCVPLVTETDEHGLDPTYNPAWNMYRNVQPETADLGCNG